MILDRAPSASRTPAQVASKPLRAAPARGGLPAYIARLQRTLGNRAVGHLVTGRVIQRIFSYGGRKVGEKAAEGLAKQLYTLLAGNSPKMTLEEFIGAVQGLADSDVDYGTLGDAYFAKLIKHGPVREAFELNQRGRRLVTSTTTTTTTVNYPPQRSEFFSALSGYEKKEHDFTYVNLRDMVGKFLAKHPLSEEQFNNAIEQGVKQYLANENRVLAVDPDYPADLQLLVEHLLNYQGFNLGQLKDLPKNAAENAFRANEAEKSEWMLTQNPHAHYDLLMPPQPVWGTGAGTSVSHAFGALIDLNRPLSKSIMGGETYKAVFLLARELYKMAFQEAEKARGEAEQTPEERFREQRSYFNTSLFSIVGQMNVSSVTAMDVQDVLDEEAAEDVQERENADTEGTEEMVTEVKKAVPREQQIGKAFLTGTLQFPFDEEAQSFDEASDYESSSELPSDEELYHEEENIFTAAAKRKRALNAIGLLAKISSQKAIIDEPSDKAKRKYDRVRRRVNRQTLKLSKRYADRYKHITSELTYLNSKRKMIASQIRTIERQLATLEFFKDKKRAQTGMGKRLRSIKGDEPDFPILQDVQDFNTRMKGVRANTKQYKAELEFLRKRLRRNKQSRKRIEDRIDALKTAKARAEGLDEKLEEFYTEETIGSLTGKRARATWREEHPEVFGNLGEKAMSTYLFAPVEESEEAEEEEEEEEQSEEDETLVVRPRKKPRH